MESVTDRRFDEVHTGVADMSETASRRSQVPGYLAKHYWWAYVHPKAVTGGLGQVEFGALRPFAPSFASPCIRGANVGNSKTLCRRA